MSSPRAGLICIFLTLFLAAIEPDKEISGNLMVASLITFGLLIAAGIGFPIPEELPIVGAGIWVGQSAELGPWRWLILPVCIAGVVISDGLLYSIGRYFGPRLLENRWVKRLVPEEKRERIQENFRKYGVWTLLFARFLPAIRSPIFVTAGIMRLSFARFVFADGIYAVPGVSLLFFLSFWFGDQFQQVVVHAEQRVDRVRPLLILLVIAAIAGFLAYHFLRRPMAAGDPEELPLIGAPVAAKIEQPKCTDEEPGKDTLPPGSTDGTVGGSEQTKVQPEGSK